MYTIHSKEKKMLTLHIISTTVSPDTPFSVNTTSGFKAIMSLQTLWINSSSSWRIRLKKKNKIMMKVDKVFCGKKVEMSFLKNMFIILGNLVCFRGRTSHTVKQWHYLKCNCLPFFPFKQQQEKRLINYMVRKVLEGENEIDKLDVRQSQLTWSLLLG